MFLKTKKFKKLIHALVTVVFLFLLVNRLLILNNKYYFLAADRFNFDRNNWQYLEGKGGIAEDGGILVSFKKGAKANGHIRLKKAKYALWMRFRAGPPLGDCEFIIDNRKFIISQKGMDTFVFKKIAILNLNEGEHFVSIRDVSKPENNITFDGVCFTTNLFFKPEFKSGLDIVIYQQPFKYIYHGFLIFIYFCSYLAIGYLIFRGTQVLKLLRQCFKSREWEKNKIFLFFFVAASVSLVLTLIFEIYKNEKVADVFAIIFYITFLLGVICKIFNSRKLNIQGG